MFLELALSVRSKANMDARLFQPIGWHIFCLLTVDTKKLKLDFIAYTMMGRLSLGLGWIHNNGQL